MQKMKIVQVISIGGLLTAITIMFQSAPVFLPGIGIALSPFSTLPIAIAAVLSVFLGIAVLISSAIILMIVSTQEAIILIFTTGLLGIMLGSLLYRKGLFITLLAATVSLSIGMLVLTYIAAVPGFAEVTGALTVPLTLLIFFTFSLSYSSVWSISFKKFISLLVKIRLIEKP